MAEEDLNNALFETVKSDDDKKVKELIDAGANVMAKNKYGETPLHFCNNADVAKLLIEEGADVNAKNKYGWTPLDL